MKNILTVLLILAVAASPLWLSGCSASNQNKGAGIGAATGAIIGGIIGHQSGNKTEGAVIGAAAGGVLGAIIGKRMDEQAKELEQVPGMEDVQYDEEEQKIEARIKILFDTDKAEIKPTEAAKLDELANVFSKYPENIVVVEGHTDSDGSEEYNLKLSQRRAKAVEDYLKAKNLDIASLSSIGYGEAQPIASNDTPEGKAMNRRVEIQITVDPSRVPQEDVQN
ncbi:MAG: OmpA family protein [Gemmatimonadetes bacterium]|nr:MAG: OmpA family protein [Gemmatimonadota bacterium]